MKKFLAAFLVLVQSTAFAQTDLFVNSDNQATSWVKDFIIDKELASFSKLEYKPDIPFFRSREFKMVTRSVLVLSSVSTVGYITYNFGDEPLREFALKHHSQFSNRLSSIIRYFGNSDYMFGAAGLVYGSGLVSRDQKLQRTGILLASTLLINDFQTNKLKDEFQRRRPDEATHNSYFEGSEGGRHYASFPSAHTSTAFAFATSVATVYHDHKWVPPVAYASATLVGLSRIYDNKHWATDVLAGATVGFLTAKGTNFLLTQAEKQLDKRKVHIYVLPNVSASGAGLSVGGNF